MKNILAPVLALIAFMLTVNAMDNDCSGQEYLPPFPQLVLKRTWYLYKYKWNPNDIVWNCTQILFNDVSYMKVGVSKGKECYMCSDFHLSSGIFSGRKYSIIKTDGFVNNNVVVQQPNYLLMRSCREDRQVAPSTTRCTPEIVMVFTAKRNPDLATTALIHFRVYNDIGTVYSQLMTAKQKMCPSFA